MSKERNPILDAARSFAPLQVLVISLQRSPERRSKVAGELGRTNLRWSFLDAVDGRRLDLGTVPYSVRKVERLLGFGLTRSEIGCYMSHMAAWRACVERNEPTLVLEDDFVLQPHLHEVLHTLLTRCTDWEMVRLQALIETEDQLVREFDTFRLVRNTGDPLASTAYLVQPNAAKRLLEASTEIYEPLDHFIEHLSKHGVEMLAVKPYPVIVRDLRPTASTITDRPERRPVRGWRKIARSLHRWVDRVISPNPYFPRRRRGG